MKASTRAKVDPYAELAMLYRIEDLESLLGKFMRSARLKPREDIQEFVRRAYEIGVEDGLIRERRSNEARSEARAMSVRRRK